MIDCALTKKRGKICVEGDFTIFNVAELKAELLESLRASKRLEVSLEGVTAIDSAGIQVLVMLRNEAQRDARKLKIAHCSEPVLALINLYHLDGVLGESVVEADPH